MCNCRVPICCIYFYPTTFGIVYFLLCLFCRSLSSHWILADAKVSCRKHATRTVQFKSSSVFPISRQFFTAAFVLICQPPQAVVGKNAHVCLSHCKNGVNCSQDTAILLKRRLNMFEKANVTIQTIDVQSLVLLYSLGGTGEMDCLLHTFVT